MLGEGAGALRIALPSSLCMEFVFYFRVEWSVLEPSRAVIMYRDHQAQLPDRFRAVPKLKPIIKSIILLNTDA